MDISPITIYTNLDALFDTRLVIWYSLGLEVSDMEWYKTRVLDSYMHISEELFMLEYSRRSKEHLLNAKLTNVVKLIQDYIVDLKVNAPSREINIVINTHPYTKLSKGELKVIKEQFTKLFDVNIELITKSENNISLLWLMDKVSSIIHYNGDDFIETLAMNYEFNLNHNLASVTLTTPFRCRRDHTKEEYDTRNELLTPVIDREECRVGLFNMMHLDSKLNTDESYIAKG